MTLSTVLVVSAVLVLVNALFVAAEFALIASPRPTLEGRIKSGDRLAVRVLGVVRSAVNQDRYIATAQLGITLASLGLGMFGEHALAEIFAARFGAEWSPGTRAAVASGLALALLTVAHIVIGEMLPKGLALQNPIGVARWSFWPMRVVLLVCYPFVLAMNGIANAILRVMGVHRQANGHEQLYTPEELQLIVEESEKGGTIKEESGRLIRELFDFNSVTASQVMVPRVRIVGIKLGTPPDQIRQIVAEHRRTRYAVYEGDLDHIVGMVHAKDLLRHLIEERSVTVASVRRIPVVPESASGDDVLAVLQGARAHMAWVVDEHGGTAGIVGLEDLFEEVVGDIDEGAPATPAIVEEDARTATVMGTVRLDELGQHFNLDLEHEEVDSVSGLVLAGLGRPPVVGDVVRYGRVLLEVVGVTGHGVERARVTVLSPEE